MHIENIKLFNFGLFRHQLIVEKFCPGINVFVGPNGSGKSSFFQAFNFLLSGKMFEIRDELIKRKVSANFDRTSEFLLIQISLDNSEKRLQIKEKNLIIKRVISPKIDKVWISNYCIEKKKLYEFFTTNGIDLHRFFFFIPQKNQIDFKIYNPLKCFEFFKKKSEFLTFSRYFSKLTLMLKRLIILKEKLSRLLKILLNKQKLENFQKKKNLKLSKINFFILILEEIFSNFEENFLNKIKKSLLSINYRLLLKIIWGENKIDFIKENVFDFQIKKCKEKQFFKKKKPICVFGTNFTNFIFRGMKLFYRLERYASESDSYHSNYLWCKNVFSRIGNLLYRKISILKLKSFNISSRCEYNIHFKEFFTNNFNFEGFKKLKYYEFLNSNVFQKYFLNSNVAFLNNIYFIFSRDIFQYKQKILRFLDQLLYEINFIKKVLLNHENNLCSLFGSNVSNSISLISELIRKKEVDGKKINGILLDLLVVYKYFEKPVEVILSEFFPSLIAEDLSVLPTIKKKIISAKNFNLNFIVNEKNLDFEFLKIKNPKLINFKSIIYTSSKLSVLIESLIGNTFLCIEPHLANKLSELFSITVVTLEGQVFNSNGAISSSQSNLNYGFFHESNMIKKERNFFYWMKNSLKFINKLKDSLNKVQKRGKKLKFVNLELNQFLLRKNRKNFSSSQYPWKFSFEKIFTHFLKALDEGKRVLKEPIESEMKKSRKFLNKKKLLLRQICLYKLLKRIGARYFIKTLNSQISNNLRGIRHFFFINEVRFFENKNELNEIFQKKTIDKKNYINKILKKQFIELYHFLKKTLLLTLEFNYIKKKKLICQKKHKIFNKKNLKYKFFYLIKIKKKFDNFFELKNYANQRKVDAYVYKLTAFYENLENNLKILFQIFNILIKEKISKFKRNSKQFSRGFQENLNLIFPKAKSCLIWKEKWARKNFKHETFRQKSFTGLKVLLKFNTGDTFYSPEHMSKGQLCLTFLIFCLSFTMISSKTVFFFDEMDVNMDPHCENLSSKLIKKISSKGIQFFIITHKKNTTNSGDKWYGVSKTDHGSLVENITLFDSNKYLSLNY